MANENVTPEDVAATVQASLDDAKDAAAEKLDDVKVATQVRFEEFKDTVSNLSLNQKLALTGAAALAASVVIQKLAAHFRDDQVNIDGDVIVVVADDIQ